MTKLYPYIVVLGLLLINQKAIGQCDGATGNTPEGSEYVLVWADEFDIDGAPCSDNWFHQTQLPAGGSWFNGEVQHYTDELANSSVSDGILSITAIKEEYTDQEVTKQYTSARLNSKFAFTYGKVEVRAKLPTGGGTWPAIWMLGKNINEDGGYWDNQGFGTTNWPACGEIDIMEHWGDNQNFVQSAMHTPSSFGGTINHGGQTIGDVSTAFHTYELEWTEEEMVFSVDGVEHYTYNPETKDASTWPYDAEQYLLLNIAIEADIAADFTSSSLDIDYVRVYQKEQGASEPNQPAVAVDAPTEAAENVISLFSDTYDDVTVDTWRTDWSDATLTDITIDESAMKEYSALNFVGIETVASQLDISEMTHFHFDLWTADATQFRVKLVDFGPDGSYDGGDDTEHEITYESPTQGEWVSYDIPLSDFTGLTTKEHLSQYIFAGQPVGDFTAYIDNIYFYSEEVEVPTAPTVAADAPTEAAENVISLFSDTYDDVSVDTWRTDWSDATLTDVTIDESAMKEYSALNFVGIETVASQLDISEMTHFHFDLWTADATQFRVKLVDFGPDGSYDGGDDTEHEITYESPVQGEWISYDIPLSDFTNLTSNEHIAQYVFAGQPVGDFTAYIDNIYFYSEDEEPVEGSAYCETQVYHFGIEAEVASTALLTIQNVDASSMKVTIESIDEDAVDVLVVTGGSGAAIGADDLSVTGQISKTLTWAGTPPTDVELNILWSKESFGGNWQLSMENITVPFSASCEDEVEEPSNDATLSDLLFDDESYEGFSADEFNYTIELGEEEETAPIVSATATQEGASVEISQAEGIPGTATVEVTALDEETSLTYTIEFVYELPDSPLENAPTPDEEAVDVISIYSDAYDDLSGSNFNPGWGQSTLVTTETIEENSIMKYASFNYQGLELSGNNDLSLMEYLHIDVWTSENVTPNIYLISPGPAETPYELNLTEGEWNSFDISLEEFSDVVDLTEVFQFKFDGGTGSETFFIDNIYFYKSPTEAGTDATLSDLRIDGTTISGFNSLSQTYEVELSFGTSVVPTVTVTTTDESATFDIDAAEVLPGSTTVEVTAADEETQLTYTINFTVAGPSPTIAAPTPSHDAEDVLSIYSDTYDNLEGTNFNPGWGQATQLTTEGISENGMLKLADFNYQGFELSGQHNVSGMTHLHLDIWTADASSANVFLVSPGPAETSFAMALTANTWNSFDIPLTTFSSVVDLIQVFQFKFDGGDSEVTLFMDNIYFYQTSAPVLGTDASLRDLMIDEASIAGFDAELLTYSVELVAGTSVAPTVSVETMDENAIAVISQATALPGSASVVVTAEDQSTTLTYQIQFTLAEEVDDPDNPDDVITSINPEDLYELAAYSAKGQLYLRANDKILDGQVELYNLAGRQLWTRQINAINMQFDIQARGIVIVRVLDATGNTILSKKLSAE